MSRPNFLVFMTDHQRGDMQPPFGKIHTPNMERLFKKGVSFTNAFCPSPHCCPSRATFFSGLYPSEHGVWNNVNVSNALSRGLFGNVRLFSEDLKDAGYQLYFSGKWHVSDCEGPENRGFESIDGKTASYRQAVNLPDDSSWDAYKPNNDGRGYRSRPTGAPRKEAEIIRPGYPEYIQYGVHDDLFNDIPVVDAAVTKINEMSEDAPFFMYVGTLGPHDPYFAPQQYLDMYDINDIELPESFSDDMGDKPALYRRTRDQFAQLSTEEHRESIRRYYAYCTFEDALFGRLLDALESKGLLENTIVMYTSDHGDYVGAHRLWAKGLPCFREAYNVTSVIGYGGVRWENKVYDDFISLADYAPTILEMAGVETDRRFVGKSFADFLKGGQPKKLHTEMYTQSNGNEVYGIQRAVFNNKFKYVFNTFDFDELYDLEEDPHEVKNLINDPKYASVIKDMCEKMWRFAHENRDNIVNPYIMTALAPYGPGIIFESEESS